MFERFQVRVPQVVADKLHAVQRQLTKAHIEREKAIVARDTDPTVVIPPEVPVMGAPEVLAALLRVPAVQTAMQNALADLPEFARTRKAEVLRESADRLRAQAADAEAKADQLSA